MAVVAGRVFAGSEDAPEVSAQAVPVAALRSGYVQLVHPDVLMSQAVSRGLRLRLRPRVVAQPADLASVHSEAELVHQMLAGQQTTQPEGALETRPSDGQLPIGE